MYKRKKMYLKNTKTYITKKNHCESFNKWVCAEEPSLPGTLKKKKKNRKDKVMQDDSLQDGHKWDRRQKLNAE